MVVFILVTNTTDEPVTVELPEAFVAVQVLKQFGGGGMGGGGMGGGGMGGGGMGGQQGGGRVKMPVAAWVVAAWAVEAWEVAEWAVEAWEVEVAGDSFRFHQNALCEFPTCLPV